MPRDKKHYRKRERSESPEDERNFTGNEAKRSKRNRSISPPVSKRNRSRSPGASRRNRSKSPIRRNRSPVDSRRNKSRSRSPVKKRRVSRERRSPVRDRNRSKSPVRERRRSKSPVRERRRSKSPVRERRRSKSPVRERRRSKSPVRERRRSKSPVRERKSKSPVRERPRRSRSRSYSPIRRKRRSVSPKRRKTDNTAELKEFIKMKKDDVEPREEAESRKARRSGARSNDSKSRKEDEQTSIEAVKAEQKKIEEEMKKRRERLEAWRAAQKAKDGENGEGEEEEEAESTEELKEEKKGWTLDDDDDDDEEEEEEEENVGDEKTSDEKMDLTENDSKPDEIPQESDTTETKSDQNGQEKEEVDPLDAFMVDVNAEVKRRQEEEVKQKTVGTTVVTVTKAQGVSTKGDDQVAAAAAAAKGELLLNNQDAVEYSDEEEDDFSTVLSKLVAKNKKKELPLVDHSKIDYKPFRKNLYVEVPELAKMNEEDVKLYRESLENIQVKGKDCPKPVRTWAQCGLSNKITDVLKKNNYEKPTPIQSQAIPVVMSGRDMIGTAKTGSGKTLAFLLPLLRHVLDQPPLEYEDGPVAVVLSPTRELAIQTYSECKKFCKSLKLRVVCVYGGTGISEQIADLKRGAEIIICTPGRMIDMLAANNGRVTNLRRVTYVVLDEADRMFDMGFEPQVTRIIANVRPDRQTVMFSATFPRQMEALARKILNKPIEVNIGGKSIVCRDIEQHVVVLRDDQKYFKLLELLGLYQEQGSVLIFVERQEEADSLLKELMKVGYPCMALHGGMDQFDRDSTIADFKNGVVKLLVATSVAARGLDVKQLVLVVNYQCPNHYEDYVHRCGRTGRAGRKGFAYTLMTYDNQKVSGEIIKALELSDCPVPPELEEMWKKYTQRLKEEGRERKKRKQRLAIGFHGKGFKFNEAEALKITERRLKQKSTLMVDSDDEGDEVALLTIDKKMEKAFGGKPRLRDPNAPIVPDSMQQKNLPKPNSAAGKALAMAAKIASKITTNKNLGSSAVDATQQAASNIMKGTDVAVPKAVVASQAAAAINAKLGVGPASAEDTVLPAGMTIGSQHGAQKDSRFEEEIEINSFPQQIRWKLTNRDALDQVTEYSEAMISVRGLYIPEGRQLKEGEKRLYLRLEGMTELAIQLAKQELKQIIKEEITKITSSAQPFQKPGRYSVL
ncbi:probable ATP-dependent RNA helicase DDX46 [Dysidea avara]|uniref:probable ATP-dependent RNA helicase DDX46 n=1 Tax=Dysidea avara TaxID=196820 RepID=UPI00332C4CC8